MNERADNSETENAINEIRLPVSVRSHAPSYFAASLSLSFFSALAFYLEFSLVGIMLFLTAWLVIPVSAFTDRIVFDGRRLIRTGPVPRIWSRILGLRAAIRLRSIEQIDTATSGSLQRGGRVRFFYRTTIFGGETKLVFAGSGRKYRQMVQAVLARVDPSILDLRSFELMMYACDPSDAVRVADRLGIPASDVLEASLQRHDRRNFAEPVDVSATSKADAQTLRNIANRLRMSGVLVRAVEAYRRALRFEPRDPKLLFEFSRCLQTIGSVRRNRKLEHRAAGALRLADRAAQGDPELLERIAETYRQFGYNRRAAEAYHSVIDRIGDAFRSLIGLAELALDEGKLAHVAHNFNAANRVATTSALRRWTKAEADYFCHLNEDDEYMELEVSRLNLLERLNRWRVATFRIAIYSLPLIAFGYFFDEALLADAGWLVASVGLVVWSGINISLRIFSPRIPYELVGEED